MRKTKRFVTILLMTILLGGCGGDETSVQEPKENETIQAVVEQEASESIDGFQKPEYEKFNSYASDNGLGGTPIYVEGKVLNQTKLGDSTPPVLALVVEQDDGKRWCVSLTSDSEIEGIKEKNVRVFGSYQGYSDVMNLPAMIVAIEDDSLMDKARIEVLDNGKYETIWKVMDYINGEAEKERRGENTEKKEICNLYDTEDLESVVLEDVTFKIPKSLYDDTKTNNEWTYYYYKDLMLSTMVKSENNMTNETLILGRDGVADGMVESSNGRVISNDVIEISGKKVIQISAEGTMKGKDYFINEIVFIYNSNLYNIGWVYEKESKFDYSKDYVALKDSIFIGGEDETLKGSETGEQKETGSNENIVYSDQNVIITYTGIKEKSYGNGYLINFTIENLSEKTLTIQLRETSINGIMVNPMCSIDVAPGKKAINNAEIWGDDVENIPMKEVKNIETKFHIFNDSDWSDRYDTENIVILNIE